MSWGNGVVHEREVWCSMFSIGAAPDQRVEEGAEPEGEALNLPVYLCYDPHLWPGAIGKDQKRYKQPE